MPPYEGPIQTQNPAAFPEVASPVGKFFTLADAKRHRWASLLEAIGDQLPAADIIAILTTAFNAGNGLPYSIIKNAPSTVKAYVTTVANRAALPPVGVEGVIYDVVDGGTGSPVLVAYRQGGYVDLTGGGGGGGVNRVLYTTEDLTGLITASGTVPAFTREAKSYYQIAAPAAGTVIQSIQLRTVPGELNQPYDQNSNTHLRILGTHPYLATVDYYKDDGELADVRQFSLKHTITTNAAGGYTDFLFASVGGLVKFKIAITLC